MRLKSNQHARTLGYLSAAPRVSTDQEAETSGARAHVLGVIDAFESLGWKVSRYIVGDRIPRKLIAQSERKLEGSFLVRLGADVMRLVMGAWHVQQSWRELNGKVDWIYERFAVFQALGWIFQKKGVPWILETNGLIFYEATTERKSIVFSGLARYLELWAYRRCDVLICITETLKELIASVAGIDPNKILVVPNGVDTKRFDPVEHKPRRLFDGLTIGFIGALFRWHRLDVLLTALSDLRAEAINFNLVVVGDGPMRETWEKQVRELNLNGCVLFLGRVGWKDVPAYLSGFDIGYMGYSQLEIGKMYGSPLKLYEYMAMGLPVVSTACPDAQEIITPELNGYLFEPGDTCDLKRVLRSVHSDQARWQEIGNAARARVLESASWKTRVQDMITGIERILEERDANPPVGN